MPKQIITSPDAPVTGFTDKGTPSPLAQAIRAGNLLFVSGAGPLGPDGKLMTGKLGAELGVEAHPMQKVLEAHVRAHLADLAEVQPEFR